MKQTLSLIVLYMLGIAFVCTFFYSHLLSSLEGDNLFLFTYEFFVSQFRDVVCVNTWLTSFLLQFFRWPVWGAVIIASFTAILSLSVLLVACQLKRRNNAIFALLPVIVHTICYSLNISLLFQSICFFVFISLFLFVRNRVGRIIYTLVVTVLSFILISTPLQILLLLVFLLLEYFHFRGRYICATYLLCGLLVPILVILWSRYVAFIPFDNRYFHIYSIFDTFHIFLWILVLSVTLLLVYFTPAKGNIYKFIALALASCVALFLLSTNSRMRYNEQCYNYVQMADQQEWNELLTTIHQSGIDDDVIKLRYSLLAESALGTLPENIFNYSINSPDEFHYRFDRSVFATVFNRQFYQTCGLYDEAMHHAAEYANHRHHGFCFSSLRQMTDYAIRTHDYPVARKYLSILQESTFHNQFVQEHIQQINTLMAMPDTTVVPMRSDNFVACYPFNSEMIRQLEQNPHNRAYLDYLLCGLLLQKDLPKFRIILEAFPYYQDKPLPKAYAEANLLLLAQNGVTQDKFQCSSDYQNNLADFLNLMKSHDSNIYAKYGTSYWYYYYYTQVEQESAFQSSNGH